MVVHRDLTYVANAAGVRSVRETGDEIAMIMIETATEVINGNGGEQKLVVAKEEKDGDSSSSSSSGVQEQASRKEGPQRLPSNVSQEGNAVTPVVEEMNNGVVLSGSSPSTTNEGDRNSYLFFLQETPPLRCALYKPLKKAYEGSSQDTSSALKAAQPQLGNSQSDVTSIETRIPIQTEPILPPPSSSLPPPSTPTANKNNKKASEGDSILKTRIKLLSNSKSDSQAPPADTPADDDEIEVVYIKKISHTLKQPTRVAPKTEATKTGTSQLPPPPPTPTPKPLAKRQGISAALREKYRGEFPLGQNMYEVTPKGFTFIMKNRVNLRGKIYQCNHCPAKVRGVYLPHHAGLHKYSKESWSSVCPLCRIFIRTDDLAQHMEIDCPMSTRKRRRDTEDDDDADDDYYKCKACQALIRSDGDDLEWHLLLHKNGTGSRNACQLCWWLTDDVEKHHHQWHSENKGLRTNAWALGPNFWVVDGDNPKYILFRQEYVSKFECKICLACYFKREEMEEHYSSEHDDNDKNSSSVGKASTSSTPPSSSSVAKVWKCDWCGVKCMEEDRVEHRKLHIKKMGVHCILCGYLLKPGTLAQHQQYFHAEIPFSNDPSNHTIQLD